MVRRQIAILYTNPLFAQSIACLLEVEPKISVSCVDASRVDAAAELRRLQPQVVLVERELKGSALGSAMMLFLDSQKWPLTIVLGLGHPDMEIFYNRRVSVATPDTLLQAVLEEEIDGQQQVDRSDPYMQAKRRRSKNGPDSRQG